MASSRPHRKCVRRLSQDAISEILSDFSDPDDDPDDPDFELEADTTPKLPRVAAKRLRPSEYSDSSNDSVQSVRKTVEVPKLPVPTPTTGSTFTVYKPGFSTVGQDIMQHTPTDQGVKYVCCVKDCSSGGLSNLDGLWLFPLPEENETRELWIQELPIDLDGNRPHSPRVCFRHFDSSKFVKRQQRLLGLLKDAVPSAKATGGTSIFTSNSKYNRARNSLSGSVSTPKQSTPTHTQPNIVTVGITPSTSASKASGNPGQSSSNLTPKLGTVSSSATSSNSSLREPKTEVFIDLTSEEAVINDDEEVSKGSIMAKGYTIGTSYVVESSAAANGAEWIESAGGVDDDAYELTLEDIEEELPWVVPDMHWDSRLENDELHLVWNNSPDQNRCKKVVLDKRLVVHVFVGEQEVAMGVKKIMTVENLKELFTELGKL